MPTPAENWSLIQRLCDQAGDDAITSVRVALFNDFNKESFHSENHAWHLLACFKNLLLSAEKLPRPLVSAFQTNLPLILVAHASGSNILNLLPVARAAKKRGLAGLIVAGDGVAAELLAEFDNVITERQLWGLARQQGVVRIVQAARGKFKKLVNLLEKLAPEQARRVRQNFGWIFRQLLVAEAMRGAVQVLLADWKPSCVISTSDYWPLECQFFCQAQSAGISTALIQHGEFTGVTCWPAQADTFLVWGSVFQEKLLQQGAPACRLRICGMPAADSLFQRIHNHSAKVLNQAAPVCLVFSHAQDRLEDPATFAAYARLLQEVIPLLPQVQWRIRLHPAEDDSFYRELGWIGHPRVKIEKSRDIPLEDAVAAADVVCTIRSTAGIQAMMMQRPVIVLDLTPGVECSVWWPLYGGGLATKNSEAFKMAFDKLLDDADFRDSLLKSQQEFLDKSFANKGKAATAIVDYLEEQTLLCSKTKSSAALA